MSGNPSTITAVVADALPKDIQSDCLCRALHWVLVNQFIYSDFAPGTWSVLKYTGMGLRHSAGVADVCFFQLADRWALQKGLRAAMGV